MPSPTPPPLPLLPPVDPPPQATKQSKHRAENRKPPFAFLRRRRDFLTPLQSQYQSGHCQAEVIPQQVSGFRSSSRWDSPPWSRVSRAHSCLLLRKPPGWE